VFHILLGKENNKYVYDNFILYCSEHKLDGMINLQIKKCQEPKCKNERLYGFPNKQLQFCYLHRKANMINLVLENKCTVFDCEKEFDFTVENIKYCSTHCPNEEIEIKIKKLCKYCDIKENSSFVCGNCKKIMNKKEWGIVRYLRSNINTKFDYNSSKMLQGCSKKRPDVFFELNKHCVIVEIDENQHKSYNDLCECSRLNEIVNGIGGKSVIIIRFNPDVTKHKGVKLNLILSNKIDLLVKTIKEELVKNYETFIVKIIQLYYDDDYVNYKNIKEEDITKIVAV
jgi:hypothetical protein